MPSSVIPSTVESTALVPYLPARRASPDDIRSRSASTFIVMAETSRMSPMTRLPPTQLKSEVLPVDAARIATKNEISANTIPTAPRAASSEGSPGIATSLAPAHRLDAGLGEQQERADDHGEVGQVARVDEALQELLEVLAGRQPGERITHLSRAAEDPELGNRGQQQDHQQEDDRDQEAHHHAARQRGGECPDGDVGPPDQQQAEQSGHGLADLGIAIDEQEPRKRRHHRHEDGDEAGRRRELAEHDVPDRERA